MINPAKIEQPRISRDLNDAIDHALDAGADLTYLDHMLHYLDWGTMREYATMTTRLQKNGGNFADWVEALNDRVWDFASHFDILYDDYKHHNYLNHPRPVILSLFDWVLDEILLAMMRATVHPSALEALAIASDPHDALMWICWYYDIDGKCGLRLYMNSDANSSSVLSRVI